MKITTDTQATSSELAAVLGITARRVRQLVEDGVIQKFSGHFPLCAAVQEYIQFVSRDDISADDKKIEKTRKIAEAKLKTAKAVIAACEADELKGKMHRADDIKALTEDMVYSIRHALLSLPGRLAVDTATAETAAETSDIIRKEVLKIMQELANYQYSPERYEELVRERRDWDTEQSEPDNE